MYACFLKFGSCLFYFIAFLTISYNYFYYYIQIFQKTKDRKKARWQDRSELCLLKVGHPEKICCILLIMSSTGYIQMQFYPDCNQSLNIFRQIMPSSSVRSVKWGWLPCVVYMSQIFGIKTLVKSYLPVKDAHLRGGIDKIMEILRNILSFGEVSKEIKSR